MVEIVHVSTISALFPNVSNFEVKIDLTRTAAKTAKILYKYIWGYGSRQRLSDDRRAATIKVTNIL